MPHSVHHRPQGRGAGHVPAAGAGGQHLVDLAVREKCAANPTSPGIEQYSPLFASGKTSDGKPMRDWPAQGIWMSLKKRVNFDPNLAEVEKFNAMHLWRKLGWAHGACGVRSFAVHRWCKRGVSMLPVK